MFRNTQIRREKTETECEICGFPFGRERTQVYDGASQMPDPMICSVCGKESEHYSLFYMSPTEQVSQAASVAKTVKLLLD